MDRIDEAFACTRRTEFLPASMRPWADEDEALPIGYGQTISQPTTVKRMLRWLDVQPGDTVLDVGSGSGWTAALLSYLVGPTGHVCAVELVPELLRTGQRNCEESGVKNAEFHEAGDHLGLPQQAPYDRILVSASANYLPPELAEQLRSGGKLVVPVQNIILEITKLPGGKLTIVEHPGYVFVPLIT